MTVYYTLLGLIVSFSLIFDFKLVKTGKKSQRNCFLILEILFILVATLSYRVGSDMNVYYNHFEKYPTFENFSISDILKYRFEPLWVLLNIIVKSIFNDFFFVKLLSCGLVNIPIFYIIKKETTYPFFAILLYFVLGWLNVCFEMLRQDISLIFFLWGTITLIKGDRKGFILRAFPMIFFHKSGLIVYLLTLLFSYTNVNKKTLSIPLLLYLLSSLISEIFPALVNILSFISEDLESRGQLYIDRGGVDLNIFGSITFACFYVLLPLYLIVNEKSEPLGNKAIQIFLFSYALFNSLTPVLSIMYRLRAYVDIFYYIAISNYIVYYFNKKRFSLIYILTIFIVCLTVTSSYNSLFARKNIFLHNGFDVRYFPYTSIWDKDNPVIYTRKQMFHGSGIKKK